MKLGYPCVNLSVGCTPSGAFRLASYSDERLRDTVASNLDCLSRILDFNVKAGLYFLRISSDIVPFASHPVCTFDWGTHFRKRFKDLGAFIKMHGVRISMHPDQFVVLNSPSDKVVKSSIAELEYHARVLDLMGLDASAKMQIHAGGVYGDKPAAMGRFVSVYKKLSAKIKKRLVVENDERSYTVADCVELHRLTGIPVLFDSYHHSLNNNGESIPDAMKAAFSTWPKGMPPLSDYSSPLKGGRFGAHAHSLDAAHFKSYLKLTERVDYDLMLEIKDKEKSALRALDILRKSGLAD